MNNQLFKEGDRVYYPLMSDKILTVKRHGKNTIYVDIELFGPVVFELNGKRADIHVTESLFHATQVKYELLTNLYPHIQFEEPKPTPAAIVKKMLDDGYTYVICNILLPNNVVKDIVRGYDDNLLFGEYGNYDYDQVIPLDNYTGKIIVDYREGKLELEDE
ncbi:MULTISPECIES: hypothetical protein [Moraxella]|nr:hypothetical protein [Moraxella catarrhalis]STY82520.1 Uncharacterised protein [Moraxella catarrhalis]